MHEDSVFWGQSTVHYIYGGQGNRLLFCFHGYGEQAASFAFLEELVGNLFTIVAIDMPFHGKTEWKDATYLEPAALIDILEKIGQRIGASAGTRHEGDGAGASRQGDGVTGVASREDSGAGVGSRDWWLMGYSMGGRVALQLLELKPDRIRGLVLLAPDGLKVHPLYWLSTQTKAGNKLFERVMKKPGWLFSVLRAANSLQLVNPSIYKFTNHYINDDSVRQELYARWTTMRGFRPNLRAIQRIVREKQIPIHLLYGEYDRIIRWERAERFRKGGIEDFCQLQILQTGHQLLHPRYSAILLSIFTDLLH